MKEAVTKLAQRLKHIIAIRRKRAKRGRFDLQQTLRKISIWWCSFPNHS
jgi:hypothetical protein